MPAVGLYPAARYCYLVTCYYWNLPARAFLPLVGLSRARFSTTVILGSCGSFARWRWMPARAAGARVCYWLPPPVLRARGNYLAPYYAAPLILVAQFNLRAAVFLPSYCAVRMPVARSRVEPAARWTPSAACQLFVRTFAFRAAVVRLKLVQHARPCWIARPSYTFLLPRLPLCYRCVRRL